MVGLYTGQPIDDPEIRAMGMDAFAAPAGQVMGAVLGQAFADLPSVRFGRAMAAGDVPVVDPETGVQVYDPGTRPTLPAAEANRKYGIPGALSWDHDVAEDTAADVYQKRRADLVRQDIINRRDPGVLTGGVARTALAMLPGFLDPMNVAASFVPAVPEARVAALLAQAGGLGERTAIRAGVGAVAGAAGQAALEPLNALQMNRDREEWTPMGAMLDVLFGAGMGGILHAGAGALGDVLHGAPRLSPEQHETIAKGAIASLVEGRPVDVAPAVQLAELWREGTPATLADLERQSVQEGAASAPGVLDTLQAVRRGENIPKGEESLVSWLVRNGGVRDDTGDLKNILGDMRTRPGLVNKNGMAPDQAAIEARQAGYFPEHPNLPNRPDTLDSNALFDAVDDEMRGGVKRFGGTEDFAARDLDARHQQLIDELERRGINPEWPDDQILAALRPSEEGAPGPSLGDLDREDMARKGHVIHTYHGTPHDFDRFDSGQMGSGEGAQFFGHGLYFAGNELVARGYHDALADSLFYEKGKQLNLDTMHQGPFKEALGRLADTGGDFDAAKANVQKLIDKGDDAEHYQSLLHEIDHARERGISVKQEGRLYDVSIHADERSMLDWDRPISEQSAALRDLASRIGLSSDESGADLYHALAREFGGKGAASAELDRAGVPGIRYLDRGSRQAGEGTRNYVVFDDSRVGIMRKRSSADLTTALDNLRDNLRDRPGPDAQATMDAAREAVSRGTGTEQNGVPSEVSRQLAELEPEPHTEGEGGQARAEPDAEEQASLSRVAMIKQAAVCLGRASLGPIIAAPASWITENAASAVKLSGQLGLTDRIGELAKGGNTAREISKAIGGRLDENDVRAVRDSLGIKPIGPSGPLFGPSIPEED